MPRSIAQQTLARSAAVTGVSHRLELILVAGILLELAFGPLAFGAVQEWAICVLQVGAATLLIIWTAWKFSESPFRIIFHTAFVPVALFGILILLQLLLNRSAYWYATWSHAMLWAAYGLIFFLIPQCFFRKNYARAFGIFFTLYGFCVALFAIAQEFTSNGKIYWVVPNRNLGWIYGPYVNHSHYAGLMELLFPIPLVIAISNLFGKNVRLLFALTALIMTGTIFLSQSLGGILAFVVEIGFLVIFLTIRKAGGRLILLAALCVALVVCIALLRPYGLADRLANLQHPITRGSAEMRVTIIKDSLTIVRHHLYMGWGLGTFPVIYPSFRTFYTNFFVNEAHNDFVQLLVETGIVGFSLMTLFLVVTYRSGFRSIAEWKTDPGATIALAALIGCSGLIIHGLGDFNLQVPANAAIFVALAAMAIAPSADRTNTANVFHGPFVSRCNSKKI